MNAHAEVLQSLLQLDISAFADACIRLQPPALRLSLAFLPEIHRIPPNSARTFPTARERCAFTVPSFNPVARAISLNSCSST